MVGTDFFSELELECLLVWSWCSQPLRDILLNNQMFEYDWWLYSHASAFLCSHDPNFQIVYLCACLLWRPSVYIYEYIYIYTFPYTIFAAPQSCLFFTSSPLSIHIKRSIHFFSKMGFSSRKLVLLVVLFNFMLLSAWSFRELEAMRLLGGGQWAKRNSLVLQSLQKGPVLPSGPSPCTHIPEQRAGRCTFNEKNIAYDIATAPPAVSAYMLAEDAAMASLAKDGYDQDHSS